MFPLCTENPKPSSPAARAGVGMRQSSPGSRGNGLVFLPEEVQTPLDLNPRPEECKVFIVFRDYMGFEFVPVLLLFLFIKEKNFCSIMFQLQNNNNHNKHWTLPGVLSLSSEPCPCLAHNTLRNSWWGKTRRSQHIRNADHQALAFGFRAPPR